MNSFKALAFFTCTVSIFLQHSYGQGQEVNSSNAQSVTSVVTSPELKEGSLEAKLTSQSTISAKSGPHITLLEFPKPRNLTEQKRQEEIKRKYGPIIRFGEPTPLALKPIPGGNPFLTKITSQQNPVIQPYKGTTVILTNQEDALVGNLKGKFAEAFHKLDPIPASRVKHFEWLNKYDKSEVQQVGWLGTIQRFAEIQGGWEISMTIQPKIHSDRYKTWILDQVVETYFFDGKQFKLISSNAAQIDPSLQVFPIFF